MVCDAIFQFIDLKLIQAFGCAGPVFTNKINHSCNIGDFPAEKQELYLEKFNELRSSAFTACVMPCSNMGIAFGYLVIDKNDPNEALVKFYFKSHVNVRRNILAYSSTNLWAEVGGYIGLLLGFSLLDLTKLVKGLTFPTLMKSIKSIQSSGKSPHQDATMFVVQDRI